jgi:hypothetical protein
MEMDMKILLLLSALVLPTHEAVSATPIPSAHAQVSVRADSDSVVIVGILADMTAAMAEVARRNGFDQSTGPAGWLETSYLASASSRPDVAEYFRSYAAYAVDLDAHIDSIVGGIAQRRFHSAGYDAKTEAEMTAAFMRGFAKTRDRQHLLYVAMQRQSKIALRLHEFLVKVDGRVAVDPKDDKALVFVKPMEHRRYNELAIAIDAANEQVAQLSGQTQTTASGQP